MRRTQSQQTKKGRKGVTGLLTSSAGVAEDSGVANVASVALSTPPASVARGTPAGDLSVHVQVTVPGKLVAGGRQRTGANLVIMSVVFI